MRFPFLVLLAALLSCQPSPRSAQNREAAPMSGGPVHTYAGVVERVVPTVVTIRSERRVRAPRQHPFLTDPFFREFFGDRRVLPQPRIERGLGSGVIVEGNQVLTNHHVVDGAQEIEVELSDRRTFEARVIGSDPPSDLAVLEISGATRLPSLALGNSDRTRVGDVVLTVGNPLGVGQTVTSGIISAKGRATGLSDGSFEDFLQTDAPINHGNSGGALVNTAGELIGINSQILSPSGGSIGIGFAIPSNMARNVMDQLAARGRVRRGQLGVGIQPVTGDMAASLGLETAQGVIVNSVSPGSAADRAGIRRGDVIVELDGKPVQDSNALRNRVANTAPGAQVAVTVIRDGRRQRVQVTLGELQARNIESRSNPAEPDRRMALGITVAPLTAQIAAQLGLEAGTRGLVILELDPAGGAAQHGLRAGDVIVSAGARAVRSAAELERVARAAGNRPLLLLVNRGGQTFYVAIRTES